MKQVSLIVILLTLMSCAHQGTKARVVVFPFAPSLLSQVQNAGQVSRTPAAFDWGEKEEKSLRRTYFSALYHQYQTLGQELQAVKEISFCPQFHHDKVETDSYLLPKVSFYQVQAPLTGKEYFPELAFSENFSFADYHAELYQEIQTLCQEGVSDNYFKFDNLVIHYASKQSFHQNPKAMAALLKIPVFANLYLAQMLQIHPSEKIFTHPEEKRIIELTRTHWFENYITEAVKQRSDLLRTQMVKR